MRFSEASADAMASSAAPTIRVPRPRRGKHNRRMEILQTLAALLEDPRCDRITTAQIAKKLNLSEAALYRNFSSKAQMFDALISFIETSLMGLFAQIREDEHLTHLARVQEMIRVMLLFAEKNRGLVRLMTGQALMKENPALTERMSHIIDKLESGLKQALREAVLAQELPADFNASGRASLIMNWVAGRWLRFVLTGFKTTPGDVSAIAMSPFFAK